MKKILVLACFLACILGINNVHAGYWNDYFGGEELYSSSGCGGAYSEKGLVAWEDFDFEYMIQGFGGCGSGDYIEPFRASYFTEFPIFEVENLTVTSSNENVVTASTQLYDFSEEQMYFERYIEYFDSLELEDFNYGLDDEEKLTVKPTWWEYNGFETEPEEWWQAYGLDHEPVVGTEVISYGHDLGKSTLTLSSPGLEDITINWTIGITSNYDTNKDYYIDNEGIVELINNYEKYKDVNFINTYFDEFGNEIDYNLEFNISSVSEYSDILNAMRGKDYTILFYDMYDTIFVNGHEITETVSEGFTYENNVSISESIKKDEIDSLVKSDFKIYIDFKYHGELPKEYTKTIYIKDIIIEQLIDDRCEVLWDEQDYNNDEYFDCMNKLYDEAWEQATQIASNNKFTLLYYNPDTDSMEVIKDNLVPDEYGCINITFDHFSSYVLTYDYKMAENIPVYRMYNRYTGEHLYTTDAYEVEVIYKTQGWGKEGIAWYTTNEGTPVYRLFNPMLGNHLYTSDLYEISVITKTQGWLLDFDGEPVMYSNGDIPIYRLYNQPLNGQHHLTSDKHEYLVLPSQGWAQEGISMYANKIGVPEKTHYYNKITLEDLVNVVNNGEVAKYYKNKANKPNLKVSIDEFGDFRIEYDSYNVDTCYVDQPTDSEFLTIECSTSYFEGQNFEYRTLFIDYIPYFIMEATTYYDEVKGYIDFSNIGNKNEFPVNSNNGKDIYTYGAVFIDEYDETFSTSINKYKVTASMSDLGAKYLISKYNQN